ncbi:hypothetical protein ACSNOK_33820, partial [Streptomyces sp. URMC 126]
IYAAFFRTGTVTGGGAAERGAHEPVPVRPAAPAEGRAPSPRGPAGKLRPSTAPLAVLAERRLREDVDRWRPDAVVSTFHLAAQVTGRMRARGALD